MLSAVAGAPVQTQSASPNAANVVTGALKARGKLVWKQASGRRVLWRLDYV